MHIVVCAKQVLDPDGVNSYALWGRLTVDPETNTFDTGDAVPQMLNAYDEQATEAALRIRDGGIDCTIDVITVGDDQSAAVLRRLVAMGADNAVHVLDAGGDRVDGFRTAALLAAAIRERGDVDLVICGRQGSDYDQGTVPAVLAERLDFALVTMAADVQADGEGVIVRRALPAGEEVVRAVLPAVVTVSNEIGQPRYPSSRRMMAARRTPPAQLAAGDLLAAGDVAALAVSSLFLPELQGHCEMIEGASPEQQVRELLRRLSEEGVLGG